MDHSSPLIRAQLEENRIAKKEDVGSNSDWNTNE